MTEYRPTISREFLNLPLTVIVPVVLVLCPFFPASQSDPLYVSVPLDVIGMNCCATHVLPWQSTLNAWIKFVPFTPTMTPCTPSW